MRVNVTSVILSEKDIKTPTKNESAYVDWSEVEKGAVISLYDSLALE